MTGRTVLACLCLQAAITPALAQVSDSNDSDDILVTATRREESILSTPLSITAVTADIIEQTAANTFLDYASLVPNLSFGYTGIGASSSRSVSIRGIADSETTGFYIDDTPVPDSLDPKIVDVARIEVLRGPQGTLYGARSQGGTVRLITEQPDPSAIAGRVHAALSDTRHAKRLNYQIDGALNLPLVTDQLAVRVAAVHDNQAGYFTRAFGPYDAPPTGIVRGIGTIRTTGFAASLLARFSDSFEVTPRVLYQKTRTNGPPYADVDIQPAPIPTVLRAENLLQRRTFDIPESSYDRWLIASLTARYDTGIGDITSVTSYFRRKNYDVENDTDFVSLAFGIPQIPASIRKDYGRRDFTQEVRFASDLSGPFQVVAGAYYNRQVNTADFNDNVVPGLNDAVGGALGTDLLITYHRRFVQKEAALYAEATYDITDKLSLIAGLRGFRVTTDKAPEFQDGIALGGPNTLPPLRQKESGVTPKISLRYKLDADAQIYATAAKGFRPGGVNGVVPPSFGCDDDLTDIGSSRDAARSYRSDTVWSYELGAKAALFDRKVRVTGALFRIDWNDIQQNIALPCGFGFKGNAGKARSEGLEFEISATPLDGLDIGGGLGIADAAFLTTPAGTKFSKGERIPQVAKYTANLYLNYTFPISGDWSGLFRADYRYSSNSLSAVNATVNPSTGRLVPRIRPSFEIINLRLGARVGQHELALFAKNVTDERASLGDPVPVAAEPPDRARVVVNQPRTLGIEFRTRF